MKKVNVIQTSYCFEMVTLFKVFDEHGRYIDSYETTETNVRKARNEFRCYSKDLYKIISIS